MPSPALAQELPVAVSFNGISHAVMLCTPQDLEDFCVGFAFSEGLIPDAAAFLDLEIEQHDKGLVCEIRSTAEAEAAYGVQRKARLGQSGCGLCGIESLDALIAPPAKLKVSHAISPSALARAARELPAQQVLNLRASGLHAAAWCSTDGQVLTVREDVGRHNALDKLIGARMRSKAGFEEGFVMMTSRASYELVFKCARAGIGALACVSAPTSLAVQLASDAGLRLYAFVRDNRATQFA
jgi:FdhD protein